MSCVALKNAIVMAMTATKRKTFARVRDGHNSDSDEEHYLRETHPAPPATKSGQRKSIEERRPEELQRVGQRDEAEKAYRRYVYAFVCEPGL